MSEPDVAPRVALIGDYDPKVAAHRAIPLALERAATDLGAPLAWDWLHTAMLGRAPGDLLRAYAGVWCVPASPYADTEAAIAAIRYARESQTPFLGTCGGFQHAMLEYAHHALGMNEAAHAELAPEDPDPLIAPLSCSLVEETGRIVFRAGTRIADAYGALEAEERYHCRFGLSPRWESRVVQDPLQVSGRDAGGEVRSVELASHPFYVATLFQPERAALAGRTPPIVRAFVAAVVAAAAATPGRRGD